MPRSRAHALSFTLALGASLLAACGGDNGSSKPTFMGENQRFPAPHGTVEAANLSHAAALAYCSVFERCRAPKLQDGLLDQEPCVAYVETALKGAYDAPARVKSGHLSWQAEQVGKCITDLANGDCLNPGSLRVPCLEGLHATSLGGDCLRDEECADEAFCDTTTHKCKADVGVNAVCSGDDHCQDGLICWYDESCTDESCQARCTVPDKPGADCDFDEPMCGRNMVCDLKDGYDHTGTCKRAPAPEQPEARLRGWTCDDHESYDDCGPDNHCIPTALVTWGEGSAYVEAHCSQPRKLGERCIRSDHSLQSPCTPDSFCDASADEHEGRCRARTALGGACTHDLVDRCATGTRCSPTTNKCAPGKHAQRGEACALDTDCYSQQCDYETKTCVVLIAL